MYSHEYYIKEALKEAEKAKNKNEVPIGAIIVCNDKIIARAYNLTETLTDTTAHAEIQAITSASNYLGGKYLKDCTLYVTLEPCVMCAGAIFWSQIPRIVFGAFDTKQGYSIKTQSLFNAKTEIIGGILENECSLLIKNFFNKKR